MKFRIPFVNPTLPPLEEYELAVKKIFSSGHITNGGPFVKKLEGELSDRFRVDQTILVSNATIGLLLCIKALEICRPILTTPFSFVATSSAIAWSNLEVRYSDINQQSYNLDLDLLPEISKDIGGIIPVHTFGNPCDTEIIKKFADKRSIPVIYDAAHAFDVRDAYGKSILGAGDVSVVSFHATKLFHTVEGGAIFTNDTKLAEKIRQIQNFGINGAEITEIGINGKMSDFHAAMGLALLPHIDRIKRDRAAIFHSYKRSLLSVCDFQHWKPGIENNYAYCPVLFKDENDCLRILSKLSDHGIQARRYFHPSLNTVSCLSNGQVSMPISENIADRILCLPNYPGMTEQDTNEIINIILMELG